MKLKLSKKKKLLALALNIINPYNPVNSDKPANANNPKKEDFSVFQMTGKRDYDKITVYSLRKSKVSGSYYELCIKPDFSGFVVVDKDANLKISVLESYSKNGMLYQEERMFSKNNRLIKDQGRKLFYSYVKSLISRDFL